ncbi:lariat debranching enzyme-like [Liolophura sinensis]|uniref:lariat debranching enzyme-like n=1 Tax=Liolophura sinensis TaxID=3198878 RepID=UPI003157F2E8
MKIAVEGCCHGELDKIYETLAYLEDVNSIKVDLLLICGDFQAVRNKADLHCMAVPPKYQHMNTFYKYYSGEKKAPVLTVFIGGNHEASNYLQELLYGGWVAPNIYYMGYANVIQFGGLRIAGLSGIYKANHYSLGHFERPPYSDNSKRSAYHIRNLDVFRLKQISRPLDICMSHDWPRGIYNFGNKDALLRHKPFLKQEVEEDSLGSPPAEELLYKLQPQYWFSAHLHTKFAAHVEHQTEDYRCKTTKFLSLDKCLPKRHFLQVIDFPHDEGFPLKLELDPEWLCILRSTNHLLSLSRNKTFMPGPGSSERWDFTVSNQEIESVKEDFGNDLTIPENFITTVPAYTVAESGRSVSEYPPPDIHVNPQTTLLCTMLELSDPNAMFLGRDSSFSLDVEDAANSSAAARISDDEDVNSDGDETDDTNLTFESSIDATLDLSCNPDEIPLENDNDEDEGIGEMEGESEANISTASSGAGEVDDAEESLGTLSGIAPIVEISGLKEEEDELQEILAAQASMGASADKKVSDASASDSQSEIGAVRTAPGFSDPERSDKSSQDEREEDNDEDDNELGEILAAQAKLKGSPGQCDSSSGCQEPVSTVESSQSSRSSGSKQKYNMSSAGEGEELPTSKKFRRRNISMYAGEEEDCV